MCVVLSERGCCSRRMDGIWRDRWRGDGDALSGGVCSSVLRRLVVYI